jgi:hypothetical protein
MHMAQQQIDNNPEEGPSAKAKKRVHLQKIAADKI